jgi:glutamate 5-kinase
MPVKHLRGCSLCYDKAFRVLSTVMYSGESGTSALHPERTDLLRKARRVVVKLGTNVVAEARGNLCSERLGALVASVAQLQSSGRQVVLVSSGAVGLGRGRLALHRARTEDMVMRQACAAVGQVLLMHAYEQLFSNLGVKIAQVLLTEDDFTDRHRASNLRHTMEKLLKFGVVPIVNENDTVSTSELEYVGGTARTRIFSDNDRLAALVASKLDANALILLSNVDGLLRPPNKTGQRSLVPLVQKITPETKALASGPSSGGRGGMLTKLEAAEIAMRAGAIAVIANGTKPGTLERIFRGEPVGTVFIPAGARMAGKRRWIAYAADVRGRIVVNPGAREALLGGKASLLWSGVVRVEREFKPLDVISIADAEGREFARGIANHSSDTRAAATNGNNGAPRSGRAAVLVTRDNIVVFDRA